MSSSLVSLSLGAGVQSSTLALMAAGGEIQPMPEIAIFADTQQEPRAVYSWLQWLEKQLPFPVIKVTRGDLAEDALRLRQSREGRYYTKHTLPVFMRNPDGQIGLAMRQCTTDHKIEVIYRELNRHRNGKQVEQWIGISRDEVIRMKPARRAWITNRWPLVELGITRKGCLDWMQSHGYPTPPRSACVFCPYHNNSEWIRLRDEDPDSFGRAVAFEHAYQKSLARTTLIRGVPYLHRSCVRLDEVDFRSEAEQNGQLNLFGNECEGMCGV